MFSSVLRSCIPCLSLADSQESLVSSHSSIPPPPSPASVVDNENTPLLRSPSPSAQAAEALWFEQQISLNTYSAEDLLGDVLSSRHPEEEQNDTSFIWTAIQQVDRPTGRVRSLIADLEYALEDPSYQMRADARVLIALSGRQKTGRSLTLFVADWVRSDVLGSAAALPKKPDDDLFLQSMLKIARQSLRMGPVGKTILLKGTLQLFAQDSQASRRDQITMFFRRFDPEFREAYVECHTQKELNAQIRAKVQALLEYEPA